MASPSSLPKPTFGKGKAPKHQEREIISNVYKYFCREKEVKKTLHPFNNTTARTAAAVGVSTTTVKRIISKDGDFSTPGKTAKRGRKEIEVDDFNKCAIRRIVHSFFFKQKIAHVGFHSS